MNLRHSTPTPHGHTDHTTPLQVQYSGAGTVREATSEQHSRSVLCPVIPMLYLLCDKSLAYLCL